MGQSVFPNQLKERGDYSGAITALNVKKVILTGGRVGLREAKNFITEIFRTCGSSPKESAAARKQVRHLRNLS